MTKNFLKAFFGWDTTSQYTGTKPSFSVQKFHHNSYNFWIKNRILSQCVPHSEFFLSYPFITNSNRVCGTSKCHSHFATFFYVFGGHKLFYLMTAHYFSGAKKMVIWGGQTKNLDFWFSKVKGQEVNLIIENTAKKSFFLQNCGRSEFSEYI